MLTVITLLVADDSISVENDEKSKLVGTETEPVDKVLLIPLLVFVLSVVILP